MSFRFKNVLVLYLGLILSIFSLSLSFRILRSRAIDTGRVAMARPDTIQNQEAKLCDIKFAILGGGAFSLALAKVLASKNIKSNLLVRNETVANHINAHHFHPKYLCDSPLPHQMWATSNPSLALENITYIIHAVPMQQSRKFLESVKCFLPEDAPILSVTKGVEQQTFSLMNDVIIETLGAHRRAAYLSGPSFAQEIMNGKATAVVIASNDDSLASELAEILSSVEFRCHTSRDVKVGT
jgi:glycerol-3-phosphate dehydrogenase (NAD+)